MNNTYADLKKCLRYAGKMVKVSKMTGLSKSTLNMIAKGRGNYTPSLGTQLILEDWAQRLESWAKGGGDK